MARVFSGLAVAVLALLPAACTATGGAAPGATQAPTVSPSTASQGADGLAALRRPWVHPTVPAGKGCPVTTEWTQPDPATARMLGSGPARPAGLAEGAVLDYVSPDPPSSWLDRTWGGAKVLWAVDPAVVGPVLIRGRRLDGPGELAFEDPARPELVLNTDGQDALPGGWKDYPSYTRVRTPGCYAYQIDTRDGTWTVVFLARGPQA